jgi:putative aldouronate transport system permease protein
MWSITIPSIMPTAIILFLLNLGHILNVGVELVLLIYNPLTYETADVIDSFVYRRGLAGHGSTVDMSLGAAVGLFKSVIGLVLIVAANKVAKTVSETSLW